MKKLLNSLMALSFVASATSVVASCNNAPNLDSKTSFPDEMSSFNKIDTDFFNKNQLVIHENLDKDTLDNFADTIKKQSGDLSDEVTDLLKQNMRVILMSNELLSQIGKIPGYHWITQKLLSQGSKFDLYNQASWKDVINNPSALMTRIVSSWMSIDDFSLSVTFFNSDLEPWRPSYVDDNNNNLFDNENDADDLRYARININQKVSVDNNSGSIILNDSNINAVHFMNSSSQPYSAGTSIVDENYIYQGWSTSTGMIDLQGLINTDLVTTLKSDDLFATPSAADLINNVEEKKVDVQIDINKIIENFNSKFFNDVTEELTNNPIYITDSVSNQTIINRLFNISFGSFFNILLTRKDMNNQIWKNYYDSNDDNVLQQKVIKVTKLSDEAWKDVNTFINGYNLEELDSESRAKAKNAKDDLLYWYGKDHKCSDLNEIIDEKTAQNLQDDLMLLINLSKNISGNGGETKQINQSGWFKVIPVFYKDGDPKNKILFSSSSTDLTLFGNNNDYNFSELFYCPTKDDSSSDDMFDKYSGQYYNPDKGLSIDTPKMADKAFLNVSVKARFGSSDSMYQSLLKVLNESNSAENAKQKSPYIISNVSPMPLEGVWNVLRTKWKNQDDDLLRILDQMDHPELGSDWFNSNEAGYLEALQISGASDLTSGILSKKYDELMRQQVRSWFTYDEETHTMPIWNITTYANNKIGYSLDRGIGDFDINNGVYKYDENNPYHQDDDVAFAKMVGNNSDWGPENPLYPTAYKSFSSESQTQYQKFLYDYGYIDKISSSSDFPIYQEYSIAFANVSSFGKPLATTNIDEDWFRHNSSTTLGTSVLGSDNAVVKEKQRNYIMYKNNGDINYNIASENMYNKATFLAYIPITPENYDNSVTPPWKIDENGKKLPDPSWWKPETDNFAAYIKYRYVLVNLYKYFVLENPDKSGQGYNPNSK